MNENLISALIGAAIAGIPIIVSAIINNNGLRKRGFDEAAFSVAVKAWENHCRMADDYASRGYKVTVGDIQTYMIYSVLVMDAANKGRLTGKHSRKAMEEIHKIMAVVDEFGALRTSGEKEDTQQAGAPNPIPPSV